MTRKALTNARLAELLACEADRQTGVLVRAFRRAARSAFLWPESATDVVSRGGELTELHGVGPFIGRKIAGWIEAPPPATRLPPERRDFLTMADARKLLEAKPRWSKQLRGDLQMHTHYSDGSGTVRAMA